MAQVDVWYTGKYGNVAQQIIVPASTQYGANTYRQICFRLWGGGAGGQLGNATTGSGNGGGGGAAVFATVRVLNVQLTFNCSIYGTPAAPGNNGFYTVVRGPSLYLLADGGWTGGSGGLNANSIATSNNPTYVTVPNDSLIYYLKFAGGAGVGGGGGPVAGGGGQAAIMGRPYVYPLDMPPVPPVCRGGANGVGAIGGGAFAAALPFNPTEKLGEGGDGGYNTAVNTIQYHSFGYPGRYFGGGGGGGLCGSVTTTYNASVGGLGAPGAVCVSYDLSKGADDEPNQDWQTQLNFNLHQSLNPNSNPMMFLGPFAIPGFGAAAPAAPVVPFYPLLPLAA